jgi:hypothetical protein
MVLETTYMVTSCGLRDIVLNKNIRDLSGRDYDILDFYQIRCVGVC